MSDLSGHENLRINKQAREELVMRMTDRLLCCSVTPSVVRSPLSTPLANGAISTKAYHLRKEKETCIGYLDFARTKQFI